LTWQAVFPVVSYPSAMEVLLMDEMMGFDEKKAEFLSSGTSARNKFIRSIWQRNNLRGCIIKTVRLTANRCLMPIGFRCGRRREWHCVEFPRNWKNMAVRQRNWIFLCSREDGIGKNELSICK